MTQRRFSVSRVAIRQSFTRLLQDTLGLKIAPRIDGAKTQDVHIDRSFSIIVRGVQDSSGKWQQRNSEDMERRTRVEIALYHKLKAKGKQTEADKAYDDADMVEDSIIAEQYDLGQYGVRCAHEFVGTQFSIEGDGVYCKHLIAFNVRHPRYIGRRQ